MTINQQAIQDLKAAGFQDTLPKAPERALIKIAGMDKSGKTHLALTGPEPIIFFSIDKGTEGVVEQFQQAGKQILVYEIRYPQGETKAVYEPIWNAFRERLDLALLVGEGTIIFDTFNEIYELKRHAKWGKIDQVPPHQYPQVYPDMRLIVDDIYNTKMSAVFINRMRKAFDPPHELEEYGYSELDFKVQMNIRTSQVLGPDGRPVYNAWIKNSRLNAKNLTNLTLSSENEDEVDRFNFADLIWLAHNWDGS